MLEYSASSQEARQRYQPACEELRVLQRSVAEPAPEPASSGGGELHEGIQQQVVQ